MSSPACGLRALGVECGCGEHPARSEHHTRHKTRKRKDFGQSQLVHLKVSLVVVHDIVVIPIVLPCWLINYQQIIYYNISLHLHHAPPAHSTTQQSSVCISSPLVAPDMVESREVSTSFQSQHHKITKGQRRDSDLFSA